MIVIGLTGSIGMGKTETARLFGQQGVPVYDADAEVHRLYDKGGAAVPLIEETFPAAVRNGAVDRDALAKIVLEDKAALVRLESIIHPMVRDAREDAIRLARANGADMIILDIPLLFEKGGEREVDYVVVVSAPEGVQRERVLDRAGMTAEKLDRIMERQVPDAEKRRRADFVVETDKGFDFADAQVRDIIRSIRSKIEATRD